MRKSWVALAMGAFISLSALAQEAVATEGKMLVASNGARLGAVYRVTDDGSAQVIIDGKDGDGARVHVVGCRWQVDDDAFQERCSQAEVMNRVAAVESR